MGRYLNLAKKAISDGEATLSRETKGERTPWPVRCSLCGEVLPGLVEGVEHFRSVHSKPTKPSQMAFGTLGEV